MNIDKIREALEAAIEEHSRLNASYGTIIAKVREALAELDKPAEPVAWMVITRIGVEWVRTLGVTKTGARQIAIERYRNGSDVQHMDPIPLYTHPPQAQQTGKALTEEHYRIITDRMVEEHRKYGDHLRPGHWAEIAARKVASHLADFGYLAPAAGLTVEEAEDCLVEHLAQYGPDWSAPARSRLRARLEAAKQAKQ